MPCCATGACGRTGPRPPPDARTGRVSRRPARPGTNQGAGRALATAVLSFAWAGRPDVDKLWKTRFRTTGNRRKTPNPALTPNMDAAGFVSAIGAPAVVQARRRAGVWIVLAGTPLSSVPARGQEQDLPGSLAVHPVTLRRSTTPDDPLRLACSGASGTAPTRLTMKASSIYRFRGCTPLRHLLSTLHDGRCRTPCKTRFRLAGCAFAGRESNTLDRDESSQFMTSSFPELALAQLTFGSRVVDGAKGPAERSQVHAFFLDRSSLEIARAFRNRRSERLPSASEGIRSFLFAPSRATHRDHDCHRRVDPAGVTPQARPLGHAAGLARGLNGSHSRHRHQWRLPAVTRH